jgi:hypothetical protein
MRIGATSLYAFGAALTFVSALPGCGGGDDDTGAASTSVGGSGGSGQAGASGKGGGSGKTGGSAGSGQSGASGAGAKSGAGGQGGAGGGGAAGAATVGPGGAGGAGGTGGTGGTGASGSAGQGAAGGSGPSHKVDLLFMLDNSASMADKQKILASTAPELLRRFVSPACVDATGEVVKKPADPSEACPAGSHRAFAPVQDMHVGVISSSLGGHGADICERIAPDAPGQTPVKNFTRDDRGRLLTRGPRTDASVVQFPTVPTYKDGGFVAWDAAAKLAPPGLSDVSALIADVGKLVVGADQIGCGYESSLEAWYRFLVQPDPPGSVTSPVAVGGPVAAEGVDQTLLAQRAAFLRPDSFVLIVMLTDEDDCSLIDGAMPQLTCDKPLFDSAGAYTGCASEQAGWPSGYVEGNFTDVVATGTDRFTGSPFPANYLAAQQRNPPGSTSAFHLRSGTPACADDPYSPACRQCYTMSASGCGDLPPEQDSGSVRCFDQKRRFGWDSLYPLQRYIDGLTKTQIIDRAGALVPNPLFAGGRAPSSVVLAALVGVPWQDLAADPGDLTKGYKKSASSGQQVDWPLVLGDPFNLDKAKRLPPGDPLMRPSQAARSGSLVTGEKLGSSGWNSVNGHEWLAGGDDLQYSCVFPLDEPRDCTVEASVCECSEFSQMQKNPLCEAPVPGDPGMKGDGKSTTTQYRAKAYPAPRILHALRGVGSSGVLGSICAAQTNDPSRADFAYGPSIDAIATRAAASLAP